MRDGWDAQPALGGPCSPRGRGIFGFRRSGVVRGPDRDPATRQPERQAPCFVLSCNFRGGLLRRLWLWWRRCCSGLVHGFDRGPRQKARREDDKVTDQDKIIGKGPERLASPWTSRAGQQEIATSRRRRGGMRGSPGSSCSETTAATIPYGGDPGVDLRRTIRSCKARSPRRGTKSGQSRGVRRGALVASIAGRAIGERVRSQAKRSRRRMAAAASCRSARHPISQASPPPRGAMSSQAPGADIRNAWGCACGSAAVPPTGEPARARRAKL